MDTPVTPRHIVILAHPDADSFNAAIAETYCATVRACGQVAIVRDLYALHFNPVLGIDERPGHHPFDPAPDVRAELDALAGGDVFVLVYPIWFGTPPAILNGYVDRVLGAGVTAREVQDRTWHGLLGGKRLLSFTTSASRAPWLAEQGQSLSLTMVFDEYLAHAFTMKPPEHVHFGSIVDQLAFRSVDEHLSAVREKARHLCATMASERHHAERPTRPEP